MCLGVFGYLVVCGYVFVACFVCVFCSYVVCVLCGLFILFDILWCLCFVLWCLMGVLAPGFSVFYYWASYRYLVYSQLRSFWVVDEYCA